MANHFSFEVGSVSGAHSKSVIDKLALKVEVCSVARPWSKVRLHVLSGKRPFAGVHPRDAGGCQACGHDFNSSQDPLCHSSLGFGARTSTAVMATSEFVLNDKPFNVLTPDQRINGMKIQPMHRSDRACTCRCSDRCPWTWCMHDADPMQTGYNILVISRIPVLWIQHLPDLECRLISDGNLTKKLNGYEKHRNCSSAALRELKQHVTELYLGSNELTLADPAVS